jgi:predicted amidohydrolase YtcJ
MYTTGAAYASKEETLKGSIEAGKFADMTVLSDDLFSVSPIDIAKIAVELTVVGGKIVFTRKNQGQ